jgi:hypothetical protein
MDSKLGYLTRPLASSASTVQVGTERRAINSEHYNIIIRMKINENNAPFRGRVNWKLAYRLQRTLTRFAMIRMIWLIQGRKRCLGGSKVLQVTNTMDNNRLEFLANKFAQHGALYDHCWHVEIPGLSIRQNRFLFQVMSARLVVSEITRTSYLMLYTTVRKHSHVYADDDVGTRTTQLNTCRRTGLQVSAAASELKSVIQ